MNATGTKLYIMNLMSITGTYSHEGVLQIGERISKFHRIEIGQKWKNRTECSQNWRYKNIYFLLNSFKIGNCNISLLMF